MALLLRILSWVLIAAAAVIGVGFLMPQKVHVARSAQVAAPPCEVYGVLNGFRRFGDWSPWGDKDPAMKVQMIGAAAGAGAYYDWSGNAAVGSGSQRITGTTPDSRVDLEVKFGDSPAPSTASYVVEADGEGSRVRWMMDIDLGPNPIAHYFGFLVDKQVGADFELGLKRLGEFLAKQPKLDCAALGVRLIEYGPQNYAFLAGTTTTEPDAIAKAMAAAYAEIKATLKTAGLESKGAPIAITHRWDASAKVYEFEAGLPIERLPPPSDTPSHVRYGKTPGGLTLRFEHQGPYSDFAKLHEQIAAYKALTMLQDRADFWEEYLGDPATTPPAEVVTRIYAPVK